ncbi:MAG: toxin-antitoxin (TA) system antitoxin [Acidobacteria bacterium]|nr:toxin-antitoxin (TA) system antitoxin [Acidobacteriota bacterium]
METKTIDLQKSTINIKELVALVTAGNEIIITEGKLPVARILPIELIEQLRQPGMHPGAIQMGENFDAPLPEEFWMGQQ